MKMFLSENYDPRINHEIFVYIIGLTWVISV